MTKSSLGLTVVAITHNLQWRCLDDSLEMPP